MYQLDDFVVLVGQHKYRQTPRFLRSFIMSHLLNADYTCETLPLTLLSFCWKGLHSYQMFSVLPTRYRARAGASSTFKIQTLV